MSENWPKMLENLHGLNLTLSDTKMSEKKTNFQNVKNHRFQHLRSIKSPKLRLLELTRYLSPRKFSDIFALSSYNFLIFLDLDKLIS